MERTIWSNENLKLEDWEDCLRDWEPEITDEAEKWALVYRWNAEYLDDERANLDINVGDGIICIADLGLWYGRRSGYKELPGNIRFCLNGTCGDYVTWFVDNRGDLKCRDCHHDGTNFYTYRAWKEGVSEARRERLREKIVAGTATREDVCRLTRKLGPEITKVYGW